MDTTEFLEAVLPDDGYYCVFAASDKRKIQKFYSSVDEVAHAAQAMDANGHDTYYATGSFREAGSREANNVQLLKSFFLDLDCGPGKSFVDQAEALTQLKQFVGWWNLPKPLIVNSGRGIHVYWTLEEAVPQSDWLPTALGLKRACQESQFAADPAITADAARVLRVPGTHNHKDSPPRAVTVIGKLPPPVSIDTIREAVGEVTALQPAADFVPGEASRLMDRLAGNKSSSFNLIMQKTMAGKGCMQLAYSVANQAEVDEPLWRATLSVAQYCEDAETAIHKVSQNHPEYDAEITEKKANRIQGPYRCERFEEYRPGGCDGCPFKNRIGSPIVLGQTVVEAEGNEVVKDAPEDIKKKSEDEVREYVIPPFPAPYVRGKEGGVYHKSKDDDGEVVYEPVYHHDLYVVRRLVDPELGDCVMLRLHLPNDGVREFTLPNASIFGREDFRKAMAKHGVTVPPKTLDKIAMYVHTWIQELAESKAAEKVHTQCGWVGDRTDQFILGDKVIYGDRVEPNPPAASEPPLYHAFYQKGSRERQREALNFYGGKGMATHQMVVAAAIGSLFMQYTPVHSFVLHVFSGQSGFGKTTTAKAGVGLFGNPMELMSEREDTGNARMNRMEQLKNIVHLSDEMTNMTAQEASKHAYAVTVGRQKNRMRSGSNTERKRGAPWKIITITTGNKSMHETLTSWKTSPQGEMQRILELDVNSHYTSPEYKKQTDKLERDINENYGFFGVEIIQFMIRNEETCRKWLRDAQERLDDAAGLGSQSRFISYGGAAILAGALLGKAIGIWDWDLKPLFREVVDRCRRHRVEVRETGSDYDDIIGDFIAQHYSELLQIKSTDDLRGQNGNGLDQLVVPESIPRGKLVARYETDTHLLYIALGPLKKYCEERQINYRAFVGDLKRGHSAQSMKMRLTKGTNLNLPPVSCLCMEFKGEVSETSPQEGGDGA